MPGSSRAAPRSTSRPTTAERRSTSEFLQTVRTMATAVCGTAPFFNISAPGTDSRVFRRVGMPVAVFGPTPYFLGAANEHVTIRDYLDVIRVHALSALEFLKSG